MKKIITLALILVVLSSKAVLAVDAPNFPSCPNPGGEIIASYNSGVHGVPGNPTTFTGNDTVYKIDETRIVQCLCLEDKTGIQTNWWKISSLSQNEIDTLKKLDWIFIPTGSAWGLEDSQYMAKNSSYSCGASTSSSGNSGSVLSASAQSTGSVLGLATTGGQIELIGLASLGIAILMLGIILRNRASNE